MNPNLSSYPGLVDTMRPAGKFHVQQVRGGKVINEFDVSNGITDAGMNALLEAMFHSGSQITTWYIGLVDNAGFSAFAGADTMASHAGWSESSAYSNGTRPQWTCGAAASRQITNAVTVDFNMNTNGTTIKGLFICGGTGASTKGGSTGTLWSAAAFGSTVALNSGDVLKVTYTLSG
jgi:hypothetical protein